MFSRIGCVNSVLGMLGEQIWIVRKARVGQSASAKTRQALAMSASLSAFLAFGRISSYLLASRLKATHCFFELETSF